MIPVDQTIMADPARGDGHDADGNPGNCWQACVASLLELPLEEVPHFIVHEDWWEATKAFVSVHKPGWTMEHFDAAFPVYQWPDGAPEHVIGSGPSPRGDFYHAAIVDAKTGELAHDPHPSRAGFVQLETMFVLIEKPTVEQVAAN